MQRTVVSLVKKGDRFLMVRRKVPDGCLRWSFPGGKIEPFESEQTASAREVLEESGIVCRPDIKIGERPHPDTDAYVSYWLCGYQSGSERVGEPRKIDEVRWMTPSEIMSVVTSDIYAPVRRYLTE